MKNLLPKDLQGWGGDHPIFEELIRQIQPRLIIEVGTWKGQSALNMVDILKRTGLTDSKIFCVDTWLGHTGDMEVEGDEYLMKEYGYPQLYYQFISNVVHERALDYITPYPNTSDNCYELFSRRNIKADLIYIDASHEYEHVLRDIRNYYNLLTPKGLMFGDDFSFAEGVARAVKQFCTEKDLKFEVDENRYWRII